MQVTRTIQARDIESAMRLTAVEGASMHVGIDGLLVEMAQTRFIEEDIEEVALDVWHDTWMFGIYLEPEAHVQVTWDAEAHPDYDPPEAPSRAGQVRVHGRWQPAGETAWAPRGHPMATPEQR